MTVRLIQKLIIGFMSKLKNTLDQRRGVASSELIMQTWNALLELENLPGYAWSLLGLCLGCSPSRGTSSGLGPSPGLGPGPGSGPGPGPGPGPGEMLIIVYHITSSSC